MEEKYPLEFLKSVSGSSDDALRVTEFEKRIADFTGMLEFLDKLSGCELFTKREVELMKLLSQGLTSKEIARKLFISPHTVDTHRRHMLKKTGQKDSSKLIAYAKENGLV